MGDNEGNSDEDSSSSRSSRSSKSKCLPNLCNSVQAKGRSDAGNTSNKGIRTTYSSNSFSGCCNNG